MNIMFFLMMTASLIILIITAPESAYTIMLSGAKSSIQLALSLIAIYAIWLSVLRIMEQIGLNKLICKLFKPLTSRLFKGENEETQQLITLNFSANLLGMGGVATPLGIKAMKNMQDGTARATHNMILFMVINATSIQLLPTTIIGMRAASGSESPSNIIFPSLLVTFITALFAIVMCKICAMSSKKNKTFLNRPTALSAPLSKDSLTNTCLANATFLTSSQNIQSKHTLPNRPTALSAPLSKDSLTNTRLANATLLSSNQNKQSKHTLPNRPTALSAPLSKDSLTNTRLANATLLSSNQHKRHANIFSTKKQYNLSHNKEGLIDKTTQKNTTIPNLKLADNDSKIMRRNLK